MPGMDGMEFLEKVRLSNPGLPFILITSQGSERLAVRALMQGAYNHFRKPFDNDELFYTVERAAETRRLRLGERERVLEAAVGVRIIGRSPALSRVLETASRVASKDVTVLIRGETEPRRASSLRSFTRTANAGSRRWSSSIARRFLASSPKPSCSIHAWRVHRCGRGARRLLRAGERKHLVPRRDRRALASGSGKAVARASGTRGPATWIRAGQARRRSRDRCDTSRPRRGGQSGQVPRRSLLPA